MSLKGDWRDNGGGRSIAAQANEMGADDGDPAARRHPS